MPNQQLNQIDHLIDLGEIDNALKAAAAHFLAEQDFHRLFEIRKLQARNSLGIPLIQWNSTASLDSATQLALDSKLLEACREVGLLHLQQGNLSSAWPYLEPLEDRQWIKTQIANMPIVDDKLDVVIEFAFHRGAHPVYGFELIIQHMGTCNAITLFDSSSAYFDRKTRQELAATLVNHFFEEILRNLNAGRGAPESISKDEFIDSFKSQSNWGGPHADATHLNSVTRIGLILDSSEELRKLWALSSYGLQLPEMFQFPGIVPFENHFLDCLAFYEGLLGIDRARHISKFENKIIEAQGSSAALLVTETVVDWLIKMGDSASAVTIVARYGGDDFGTLGIAPNLIASCQNDPIATRQLLDIFRSRDDCLSFLMTRLTQL